MSETEKNIIQKRIKKKEIYSILIVSSILSIFTSPLVFDHFFQDIPPVGKYRSYNIAQSLMEGQVKYYNYKQQKTPLKFSDFVDITGNDQTKTLNLKRLRGHLLPERKGTLVSLIKGDPPKIDGYNTNKMTLYFYDGGIATYHLEDSKITVNLKNFKKNHQKYVPGSYKLSAILSFYLLTFLMIFPCIWLIYQTYKLSRKALKI